MNKQSDTIRQSLAAKLGLGYLLLTIVIFVVSLGIFFIQSHYLIRKEAIERGHATLSVAAQRVVRHLTTVETATDINSWLATENLQPDSLLAYTHRITQLNPDVDGCSITTEPDIFPQYGRYFSAYTVRNGDSITTVREAPYEYFEKVWYKTPKAKGHACWVDPFDDYTPGTLSATDMIASYCKPLYDGSGRFVAVISTDLSLPKLSKAITAERPYPHSYFVMIGEEGYYFVHPDSAKLFHHTIFDSAKGNAKSDIVMLGHEMTTGKTGYMKMHIDGRSCIVSYQPVPHTPWSIALVSPESDIFSHYTRLLLILIPLTVVGILIILLLCRRAVNHAIKPLKQLLSQSHIITSGNYEATTIAHSSRTDVVGALQNSFATMQESLSRHVASIREGNAELERRNKELEHARELAEKGSRQKTAFIQNVTHQVRTPLNIIMGFSQVLRDNASQLPEEELRNVTNLVNYNMVTLYRMAGMLYDSSDNWKEELFPLDDDVPCNAVTRQAIADTQRQYPDMRIDFHTDVPDTLTIRSSYLYMLRCLRELLYNAGKYSNPKQVTMRITQTDRTIRFVCEDLGPGIAEAELENLFKPFSKTDDLSEGLGLGLPLTKRHCRRLGGDLTLDTTYHDGCRFVIELPKT